MPNIHTEQRQNMLEILQDCFEEKSLVDDFITNSTESVLCLTPKMKDSRIQSTHKECQRSHSKSVPVSSGRKEASLQGIGKPGEAACRSVQDKEIYHKALTTDASTPNSKELSSKNPDGHHSEDDDCYLSIGSPAVLDSKASESPNAISSVAQKREAYIFRNSVNRKSSSRLKKRLNFDISTRVEIENKVSEVENKIPPERQQEEPSSELSEKRVQDLGYEIQSPAKKSFSTLFLETVRRKGESSSIVRHSTTVPPLSSPNDMQLLEDEFIIAESEKSSTSQPWVVIPRKGRHLNHAASSSEKTGIIPDKPREKSHSVSSKTLIGDTQSHKASPGKKSQPSDGKKLSTGNTLTKESENNCTATEYEMHSANARKTSGSKRTIKQKRRKTSKANVVEEQINMGQGKNENRNMSCIAPDELQINSDRNTEDYEEARNESVSKKQMPPVGNKEKKSSIKKDKEKSRKKRFSSGSKNKLVPEEVTLTVLKTRRISRQPSDWWVVKTEKCPVATNSSGGNELSVYQNRQKQAKKNQLSKNTRKKPLPSKRQKTATRSISKIQKVLDLRGSGGSVTEHEEISSPQNGPLQNDKENDEKENLDHSGTTGYSKSQNRVKTVPNVRLKSHTSERARKTPKESNLDSGKPSVSDLEESGFSRFIYSVMSGKNNSDKDDKEVQESLDDSTMKRSEMSPVRKMHQKIVLPSNTPNVRRTKRIRLKPLEYWRGERIDYQESQSGGFVIGGVISPGLVSPKRKAKRDLGNVNKKANSKRICLDNHERKNRLLLNLNIPLGDPLQPTPVKDPETREIIFMDLIRPQDTYQFFVEHGNLKVFKTLDTPFFSTGKLVLGPCEEKGMQHVGQDILVFYVTYGDVLCTLHETPYIITTGDSFYVPSGNYYNIRNLLNEESILLFTQIKR